MAGFGPQASVCAPCFSPSAYGSPTAITPHVICPNQTQGLFWELPVLKVPISIRDLQTFALSPSQLKSNLSTKFYFEMLCIRTLRIEKQQLSNTGRCFSVYPGLLHTGVKLGHCTQVPALPR